MVQVPSAHQLILLLRQAAGDNNGQEITMIKSFENVGILNFLLGGTMTGGNFL